ncbi:MAG TPA: hypothetical protein VG367_20455 [Mucilaginibacter sp.]|jgi:hypothetical protein|nr:hypothetical protein [Mucilaginibacter sp.]
MKKILWIILALSSFAACKKSKMPPVVLNSMLIGKWELHSRSGGNIYPPDTTYQPGNGNMLQFNADSTYKSYTNGTLSRSGIFHTRTYISASAIALRSDLLYFDNDTTFKSLINIGGGVLIIRPFMPDIGTTEYNKIAN